MAHKEIRELIRQILKANPGYSVEQTKGGHYKVKDEQGRTIYSLPGTPGGGRWKENLQGELRRKGLI
jgi:hypothetical protein